MKKIFYVIIFNLCMASGFSQEYEYLLVNVIDANKIVSDENGQLINDDKKLDDAFKDFGVFSYRHAYPKAKNEYLKKFAAIECNCDVKELAKFLEENFSTSFTDIEYTQDLGHPDYDPSDAMWYQTNPDGTPVLWHLNKIEADDAWDITKGSSDITVAVIDQGFDISHPDLANKTLSTTDPRTGNPYGYTTEYHGTFCASSAGAETDGGGPLASVGFNTMLWLYDYDISAADIAYHASFDKGADVISFSWGGLTSATTREKLLVQEVLDNGTVIVRSAGNSQSDSDNNRFPFAYQVDSRIIIVSGTDKNDNHTNPAGGPPYANYPQVSVCSPGYSVMGAIRFDSGATTYPYQVGGGTSYATPIVAGVCALLKSVNKNLTPEEIKNIIQTTVDPIADANMYPGLLGTGRVNAYKAVQKAVCTTVPPVYFTNQTVTTDTTVTSDCDINVQNVTVTNGATLTLEAAGRVNIISGFEVELGSKFEIKK